MSEAKKPINGDHLIHTEELLRKEGLDASWQIVVATDLDLQIDVDNNLESPPRFAELLSLFSEQHEITFILRTVSRSGKGTHLQIGLKKPLSIQERIAWQLVLGSDPKREALALISVEKGWKNPLLLFERKPNA